MTVQSVSSVFGRQSRYLEKRVADRHASPIDRNPVKHIVPLHHGRMWLLMYIHTCIPPDQLDLTLPRTRELARMSVESSIMILRWGVESRVWMP